MVFTYFKIGLMIALNVETINSLVTFKPKYITYLRESDWLVTFKPKKRATGSQVRQISILTFNFFFLMNCFVG